ncbi:MAG: ribonuclease III, partial [Acidobacteria bacterium]|nr:ribonuclease III [Acidobacteriota bacterium]
MVGWWANRSWRADMSHSDPPPSLQRLCLDMGYRFKDPELLQRALTHRSFSNEMRLVPHNELLEFIGDSVLGLVVAQILFEDNPEAGEGRLSRIRSAAVNRESLAEVARRIGLGQHRRLGRGEGQS